MVKPKLHFKIKPVKMPMGLKSGLKKILKFWIYQHLVIFSEAAKIKHSLSLCMGASVAVAESKRSTTNTTKYHKRPHAT